MVQAHVKDLRVSVTSEWLLQALIRYIYEKNFAEIESQFRLTETADDMSNAMNRNWALELVHILLMAIYLNKCEEVVNKMKPPSKKLSLSLVDLLDSLHPKSSGSSVQVHRFSITKQYWGNIINSTAASGWSWPGCFHWQDIVHTLSSRARRRGGRLSYRASCSNYAKIH